MRKFIISLLSFSLLCTFALSVSADVIWEPYGDTFYEEHRSEMQYENRFYKATKDKDLYKEPNGDTLENETMYADELFNVQYIYRDENGVLWGNCYRPGIDSAWLDLSGCLRPYDREDFRADYENEFVKLSVQPDASFYEENVPLYDYPGAETSLYNISLSDPHQAEYLPEYVHTYTDASGNVWAELFYYMGLDGWILLEGDISTAQMPDKAEDTVIGILGETEEPGSSATETATEETVSVSETQDTSPTLTEEDIIIEQENSKFILPVLLVVAVVAVTLAVLFIFFRKKKTQ